MTYRVLDAVTTPSSVPASVGTPFSDNPVFRAIQFLEGFGYRVLPPKPARTGKRGRRRIWKMLEMKAALLGAVEAERESSKTTTRRPFDSDLVRRLQKKGLFPSWKDTTLRTELSKARRWAKSAEGQTWIDEAARTIRANNPELFQDRPFLAPA
jgi:hypothetical protein